MTEVNIQTMTREEFEQHHSRTWDYVARVGKLWEGIAEEQQAIIDGKGYLHLGYGTYEGYWEGEFKERTGWSYKTIDYWLVARRNKGQTPFTGAGESAIPLYDRLGPSHWNELSAIKEPQGRAEFLERYEQEIKPKLRDEGVSERIFREGIKEFKGERVRDLVSPTEMREINEAAREKPHEAYAFDIGAVARRLDRIEAEDVAKFLVEESRDTADIALNDADTIIEWHQAFKHAVYRKLNQGLRSVK